MREMKTFFAPRKCAKLKKSSFRENARGVEGGRTVVLSAEVRQTVLLDSGWLLALCQNEFSGELFLRIFF